MAEIRAERTDLDIQDDIEAVLAHYPPLTHDRHHLQVTVQNGTVTASGYTRTSITRRYLVNALKQIPGVTQVNADSLYCDDGIRLDIGRVIPVGVIANVMHGTVILTGALPAGSNEADVVTAIANIPGVRAVKTQFA